MLSLESLKNFYFLPDFYDMRCGAQRILETIKIVYGRYPYGGDVFIFMSKNRRRLKMVQYENNAFYIHEKVFKRGYKFMRRPHSARRSNFSIGSIHDTGRGT